MSKSVENWTYADVGHWLETNGLGHYVELFCDNEIDGAILLTMTENDVRQPPVLMKKFGDIRKFGIAVKILQSGQFRTRAEDVKNSETESMQEEVSLLASAKSNNSTDVFILFCPKHIMFQIFV